MSALHWYFAYGSNMQPATFRGRRGIEPVETVPARLDEWQLVVDKPPLIPLGHAMANVVRVAGGAVYGVAYAITTDDLAHVDLTEGVAIGNYERVAVDVVTLDGGARLAAHTLTSERRDPGLRPSDRYMSLLIEGAEVHGLPGDYLAWLRDIPCLPESAEAKKIRAFIDQAMKKEPR